MRIDRLVAVSKTMKKSKLLLLATCLVAGASPAMRAADAQESMQKVDGIVKRAMDDRGIPGMQVAIVHDGRVVFSRSYGVANLQTPVPVTSGTLFSINSITKAFTGIAVMEEVEKGRVDLSVPISNYLSDIPPSWGKVTMLQLLGQTSGLPDIMDYTDGTDWTGILDDKAAWSWALSQPASRPGERESYCQTNLRLVQLIINKLNGRAPDASLIDEELSKASMTSTSYGDSRDVVENKSQPYRFGDSGILWNHFERFGPLMHANSGLNTTADDMARWMISILDGKQMSERSRDFMWTPVRLNDGSLSSFAIGWDAHPHAGYSSFGMFGGARSAFALYPKYNLGVVILTNLLGASPEELTDEIAASIVPSLELSGVVKLRADAERTGFANLDTLIAQAEAQKRTEEFTETELVSWIVRLSSDHKSERAVKVSNFYVSLYPESNRALRFLAASYESNAQHEEARRTYKTLISRDPNDSAARAYLGK